MESRYFALLVSGRRQLPSVTAMETDIAWHENLDLREFADDAARLPTLTDYFRFMEGMAHEIGCRPPLQRLFFREPRTWTKVMFGPITGAQYRLVGPEPSLKKHAAGCASYPPCPGRCSPTS